MNETPVTYDRYAGALLISRPAGILILPIPTQTPVYGSLRLQPDGRLYHKMRSSGPYPIK